MRLRQYKELNPPDREISAFPVVTSLVAGRSVECIWGQHDICDGCPCGCHVTRSVSWLCRDNHHKVCVASWCECKCHSKDHVSDFCKGTTRHSECDVEWCECKCHEVEAI